MSYKIFDNVYTLTGIVGELKLPEKEENYLYSCEQTLKQEVEKNFNFVKDSNFLSSPVCVLCDGELETKNMNLIRKKMSCSYMFKAKQNNVVHKLWKVEEKEIIDVLVDFFKDKDYYIISGTEKYESAIKYRDFLKENSKQKDLNFKNSIMALAFLKNDFSFATLPVHRLVSGINMFFGEEILNKASKYFDINFCKSLDSMRNMLFSFRRNEKHAFGIYADGSHNVLVLKDEKILNDFFKDDKEYEKFDTLMVDEFFLKEVLKLNSSNISYCCVDKFASDVVDSGDACFAIYLSAVRSEDFFNILKSKGKFPEKSFYFFPKPVEGLLFYDFELEL